MPATVALIGDRSDAVTAHRAIPRALELAAGALQAPLAWEWVETRDLDGHALDGYAGLWAVPASPYRNPEGVFRAIRWARENHRPFLGTCGGFQHAVIEFARHVAGLPAADHAETAPDAPVPVITALSCSHVEVQRRVRFAPGSRLEAAYGADSAVEGYRCNYGLNAAFAGHLERAGLRFTAWDEAGDIRAGELPAHPFFVGTLFQPERAALEGRVPPLVRAFASASLALG